MNNQKTTLIQRTFVEKVLGLSRLFFYAGLIIYPNWDIYEAIEGKQEGLISLGTLNKIIKKIKANNTYKNSVNTKKMSKENPLRGVIICTFCKRRFTSWNTSKMVKHGDGKVKKLYPYYGCANSECKERVYIKKDILEKEFENFLKKIEIPTTLSNLVDSIFIKTREESQNLLLITRNSKQRDLEKKRKRKLELEESILKTRNIKLQTKFEEERTDLECRIELMEEELNQKELSSLKVKELLSKAKVLFESPIDIWTLGSSVLKELLVKVWFEDSLCYSKSGGLRTTENNCMYNIVAGFKKNKPTWCIAGTKDRTAIEQFLISFQTLIKTKASEIEAIRLQVKFDKENKKPLIE